MNVNRLVNTAMLGLDRVGFQLDAMGITNKVNRHNLIALVMLEQKHLAGELDSLTARFESKKSKVDQLSRQAERVVRARVDQANSLVKKVRERAGL